MMERRRAARLVVAVLALALGARAASAADGDAAPSPSDPVRKIPQTAEDFFWAVDALKKGTSYEELRALLGDPESVKATSPQPGETTQTWTYKVTPMASPKPSTATTEAPAKRAVEVILYQPLGGKLGYVRSEVFLPALDQDATQALWDAAKKWKELPTLRGLVAIAKLLPRGTPAEDIQKLLGKPVDAFVSDVNVAGSERRMTYLREPNLKVEFNLGRATGGTPGARYIYVGATLYDEGR